MDLNEIYGAIIAKVDTYIPMAAQAHRCDNAAAERIVAAESEMLMTRLHEHMTTAKQPGALTTVQAVALFAKVLMSGLTFSEIADHVYISRLKGSGSAVAFQVTANGLLHLAKRAGAISHTSEVVLAIQGEPLSIESGPDGNFVVRHQIFFEGRPPFSFDIFTVGYMYITYPSGQRELHWIDRNRMAQFRQKSSKPASYDDERFVKTKVLRHCLKNVGREFLEFDL